MGSARVPWVMAVLVILIGLGVPVAGSRHTPASSLEKDFLYRRRELKE